MLFDLKSLDIDPSQNRTDSRSDSERSHCTLCRERSSKSPSGNHYGSDVRDYQEECDDVTIDPMEEECFIPDHWDELPDYEKTCWDAAVEMDADADVVVVLSIPVSFTWCCRFEEVAVDVEIRCTC